MSVAGAAALKTRPFLQQAGPLWSILATFPLVTLPLLFVGSSDLSSSTRMLIYDAYLCLFGITHFLLTFTVYMHADNREHYRDSSKNKLIYLHVPLVIFLFFPLFFGTGLADTLPGVAAVVLIAVRFANYRHLTRQAYGVSRLLGRSYEVRCPPWQAVAEHALLSALTLLMFLTFLYGGEFVWEPLLVKIVVAASAILTVVVAAGYARAAMASERVTRVLPSAAYLTLQIASILLAVYRTELYVATLAMHYVEYHVLMVPRCFETKLRSDCAPDRIFAALRANRAVFYGGLVALAVLFMAMRSATQQSGGAMTFYMFDALFVFHYFVESYIWRFSEPHYRRNLGPLYFARA
jgi:hypothetical protein